jgi:PiT family inorganic phosphate transporter
LDIFGQAMPLTMVFALLLALGLALSFEFVNGFHDTANAVATVIYTNTLKPVQAVVWSGIWNLIGVLASSGLVAFSVVALLPTELVLNVGSSAGFAMVFSLLISAILWNVGTWYLGLPASSSHTLIGSVMGVGMAHSLLAGHAFRGSVNWLKVREVFTALFVSPLLGFLGAALLLLLLKTMVKQPQLYESPKGQPPPMWIRAILMLTCTGVSFFHGSNDGQKGMGLIVLILVGMLPSAFALNPATGPEDLQRIVMCAHELQPVFEKRAPLTLDMPDPTAEMSAYLKASGSAKKRLWESLEYKNREIAAAFEGRTSVAELSLEKRKSVRTDLYLFNETIAKLIKQREFSDQREVSALVDYQNALQHETKYIPTWVKVAVALALGCGTMVGWRRIVVTVGEKIGKEHLTYAQGASAELVTMATIGLADRYGLPVSTTHVLSSGIAGTMAANRSGIQTGTIRNILLAWLLTLPICVVLGAGIFSAVVYMLLHVFGIR